MKCFVSMGNDHIVTKVNESQICKINDIYRSEKKNWTLFFFLKFNKTRGLKKKKIYHGGEGVLKENSGITT